MTVRTMSRNACRDAEKFRSAKSAIPDPKYSDQMVARFINMHHARWEEEHCAERIFYDAFDEIEKKTRTERLRSRCSGARSTTCDPAFEVKSRRVGGATYQVPIEVGRSALLALAMRWLKVVCSARGSRWKSMAEKLANELIDRRQRTRARASRSARTRIEWRTRTRHSAHFRW